MEVEKTYELILKKKEEQLSRDALLERQATQLTKYFIRARQRELKDTVEKQVEQSRKHYERNLQKTRAAGEAAAAVAQMVQEEKVIISAHMAEKGKERLAEEHRVKSERREREKWQQARILYERFQAEERVRLRQEVEKERLKKLQDSLAKHAENIKDHRQNEAEEIKARRENNAKRAELVHGSRREKQKIRQKVPVMPRLAKRRKLAIVVIATALITFTGLKARSAEVSAEQYEESLRKAQDTVKMGKTLEEEGVKVKEEERETIGREQIDLDMKLEKKEAVLEERVRRTERLLQQEEKELDDELPAIEREAGGEKVKQLKDEKLQVEAARERLRAEELEIRQSERRIDEEVRRLRRDRALRVFNVLPAFKVLLGAGGA